MLVALRYVSVLTIVAAPLVSGSLHFLRLAVLPISVDANAGGQTLLCKPEAENCGGQTLVLVALRYVPVLMIVAVQLVSGPLHFLWPAVLPISVDVNAGGGTDPFVPADSPRFVVSDTGLVASAEKVVLIILETRATSQRVLF